MSWQDSSNTDDDFWTVYPSDADWSGKEALVMWIHATKPGQIFQIRLLGPGTHWHMTNVKVSWKGWKEVRLPLHGKKSPFRRAQSADWKVIQAVQFYKKEGLNIDLVVDDVMLENGPQKTK